MIPNKKQTNRRKVLKSLGVGGTSLSLLSGISRAKASDHLEGVAYDLHTHEILSDASATVARSAAGLRGQITVGKTTVPVNVGRPEEINKEAGRSDSNRFQTEIGGKHAVKGVDSKQYFVNTPECLAAILRTFNPNRPTNFDGVGFCLMDDYETAHNTIRGER